MATLNLRLPKQNTRVTASHRPVLDLRTVLLLEEVASLSAESGVSVEMTPLRIAQKNAKTLLAELPPSLLGDPDVGPFEDEVHLHWTKENKQIVLMCFPNRTSLVHHYLRVPNAPSEHGTEEASADELARWLVWLYS